MILRSRRRETVTEAAGPPNFQRGLGHLIDRKPPWIFSSGSTQGMPERFSRFCHLLLIGLPLVYAAAAQADINAFEFRLVETDVKRGDAVVAVRVVNKSTEQP